MDKLLKILLVIGLCIVSFLCKDREPENPLDPDNPNTRGQAYTIQAVATGIGKVQVHWRKVNQPEVKSYRLYRSVLGESPSQLVDATDTLYFDTQLQAGRGYSYFYHLIWEDGRELHQSPTASVMTFNAPTGLTITNVARNRVEMQWNSLGWLDNYARCRIYRESGGAFSLHDSTSTNQYVDTRVDTGITYHYKLMVVATDGSQSNYSAEAYATPGNSAPVIDSLRASQPFMGWGERVTITCYAHDNDGDPISYSWQVLDGGTISGSGKAVTFTVPQDTLFTHRVMVTVSDAYSVGGQSTIAMESAQILLSENFDSYSPGIFPSSGGWRLVWNGAGTSYQVIVSTLFSSSHNSMQMRGTGGWSAAMDHSITPSYDVVWFEVEMRINNQGDGGVGIWNLDEAAWGQYYCYVYFGTDGKFYLGYGRDGLEGPHPTINYTANRWYKIRVKFITSSGKATMWVDDILVAQNVQLFSGGTGYRQFLLRGGWSGSQVYFDDIKVWAQ